MAYYNFTSAEYDLENTFEDDNPKTVTYRSTEKTLKITLIFVLFLMGLILGITLIVQQAKDLQRQRAAFGVERIQCILLINLGVSQLMVSCWMVLTAGLLTLLEQWYAGNTMCKLVVFLFHACESAHAYSVMAVLIAQVTNGLSRRVTSAPLMYLRFIIPAWLVGAVWNIPKIIFYGTREYTFGRKVCATLTDTRLSYISVFVVTSAVNYILQFLVSFCFLVVAVVLIIIEKTRGFQRNLDTERFKAELQPINEDETHTGARYQSDPRKYSCIPLICTFVYFACMTPPFVMGMMVWGSDYISDRFFTIYQWVDMLRFASGPCVAVMAIICTRFKV